MRTALPHPRQRIIGILATAVIAVVVMVPLGAALQIVFTAQFDDRTVTRAIVLLDTGPQWGDPAEIRAVRVAHAAELYREGVAPVIVVAGRQRSLAGLRAAFDTHGIPQGDVVFVPTSADTIGSMNGVASFLADLGWNSVTLVTDRPRAARAGAIADHLGLDAHLSAPMAGPNSALSGEALGSETIALLRHYLLQRSGVTADAPGLDMS